ncbi:MAG: precorrin-6y C5,15-methyltransferase (decarboxylating) subunit CbiE, partial [bacterium]
MTDCPQVTVVGIEADGTVMPQGRTVIQSADVILGWDRHLRQLETSSRPTRRTIEALDTCVPTLKDYDAGQNVVLLATGDPLFYGIGGYLRENVPLERLSFIPARSSIQLAFASLKEPYNQARFHSLHGRDLETLRTPLTRQPEKLALFTEPDGNTPERIFEFLQEIDCDRYDFYLCECLTGDDDPKQILELKDFPGEIDPLNLVVLVRSDGTSQEEHPRPGIGSEWFRTEEDSMVSREDVRMLNLGWLQIMGDEIVWEIGAGTGSISLESARLNPEARYYAIEKRKERFETLRDNIRSLETFNVIPRHQSAPEAFESLPSPDRVILGGSGGEIKSILSSVDSRITSGTRIVANFITLGNFNATREFFFEHEYEVSLKQITVHEDRQFGPGYTRWEKGPCVYLIRADK